ncbi:MAG: ABC transporter substrate-binding protein [Paenibacillaceae bacterium]|nr:ABC transporter substrate-binding protein [Paenibacillaceae bacterium]
MHKRNKTLVSLVSVAVCSTLVLSACNKTGSSSSSPSPAATSAAPGNSAAPSAAAQDKLEPVELIWYFPVLEEVPKDLKTVQDEMNKYLKDKINATIVLKPVISGEYGQKINTVLAASEPVDILWDSLGWLYDYIGAAAKGAIMPLDDLLDKYGQDIKKSLPAISLQTPRVEGKLYAIPSYQTMTNREGVYIQKRFADKYKLDVNSIKKLEDLIPFMEQVKQGEPDVIELAMEKGGLFGAMNSTLGFEVVGEDVTGIELSNPKKVVNIYELPIYKKYLEIIRNLYVKGYINKDAGMIAGINSLEKTGKVLMEYSTNINAAGLLSVKESMGGNEVIQIPFAAPFTATGNVAATMNSINKKSKHPERAMMFLNLLNSDKTLYNLITWGVEGKHYTKVSDNVAKPIKDSGYSMSNYGWIFGNTFNAFVDATGDPTMNEQILKQNQAAVPSPILGFNFNTESVQSEIANYTTVKSKYLPALATGSVEPGEKLDEFLKKLKEAGADKVVQEAQRQLDEWYKTKK